jgi:outer membrane protein OmpA-like peptidoglycan-associated protein
MDRQEETLRHELEGTGVRVQRNGDDILLVMPGNITFATGSSELDYGFTPVLDSVVKVLQKYEKTTLQVDGFTDSRGSEAFNQQLSERRSGAVAQYLASSGVQPSRIDSRGWGERHPVASNETAAGQALNRRVELNIRGVEAPVQ